MKYLLMFGCIIVASIVAMLLCLKLGILRGKRWLTGGIVFVILLIAFINKYGAEAIGELITCIFSLIQL